MYKNKDFVNYIRLWSIVFFYFIIILTGNKEVTKQTKEIFSFN